MTLHPITGTSGVAARLDVDIVLRPEYTLEGFGITPQPRGYKYGFAFGHEAHFKLWPRDGDARWFSATGVARLTFQPSGTAWPTDETGFYVEDDRALLEDVWHNCRSAGDDPVMSALAHYVILVGGHGRYDVVASDAGLGVITRDYPADSRTVFDVRA